MIAAYVSYYGVYTVLTLADEIEHTNPLIRIETYDQIGLWATPTKRRFALQWMIKVPLFCTVMAVTCADVCQFGRIFGIKDFFRDLYELAARVGGLGWEIHWAHDHSCVVGVLGVPGEVEDYWLGRRGIGGRAGDEHYRPARGTTCR
jgi:hypothetical protein